MSRYKRGRYVMFALFLLGSHGLQAAAYAMAVTLQQTNGKPASAVDPCSLLKKEDAAAALGDEKPGGPHRINLSNVPGFSECTYRVSRKVPNYGQCSSSSRIGIPYPIQGYCSYSSSITLAVIEIPSNQVDKARAQCLRKGTEAIPDLGDVACWTDSSREELRVTKGTISFSLRVHGEKDPTEAIMTVTRKVYERLTSSAIRSK